VIAGNRVVDTEVVDFGIREFRFEAESGFWLNGRNFKIKGVCLHHDASAFGAAVSGRGVSQLKELGVTRSHGTIRRHPSFWISAIGWDCW
jgi:beta-galactosidase